MKFVGRADYFEDKIKAKYREAKKKEMRDIDKIKEDMIEHRKKWEIEVEEKKKEHEEAEKKRKEEEGEDYYPYEFYPQDEYSYASYEAYLSEYGEEIELDENTKCPVQYPKDLRHRCVDEAATLKIS